MSQIAACALSVVSTIFFIIGSIGYSDDNDTIENVAWLVYDDDQAYYALRAVSANDDVFKYSDCSSDTCDSCETDGKVALAFLIIAIFTTVAAAGLHGSMASGSNDAMKIPAVVTSLLGFIASLISVATFMGDCYVNLRDETGIDKDKLDWGPGSILSIIGMLLMFLVTCLSCVPGQSSGGAPNTGIM
eukprot:gene33763-40852_t